jgi:hypothetical protein
MTKKQVNAYTKDFETTLFQPDNTGEEIKEGRL